MRSRFLVPSLIAGSLAATCTASTTLVNSGCGGCGYDPATITLNPAPPDCLHTSAKRGWGCIGGGVLEGDNTCTEALTIPKDGTTLAADLVVQPGQSWSVDVPGDYTTRPKNFVFMLGNEQLVATIGW